MGISSQKPSKYPELVMENVRSNRRPGQLLLDGPRRQVE